MKEFDFDEIDRAVNSHISDSSATVDTSLPVPTVTVPAPQPLATRRSSGRFMDVVHPSSDMRTKSVPARPVSREGINIAPVRTTPPVAYQPPEPVANDWPDPLDFNAAKPVTDSIAPVDYVKNDQAQDQTDDDTDINQIAEAINQTFRQDQEATFPLESPFLADAKVDKRPLGAFSAEATVPAANLDLNAETESTDKPELFASADEPKPKHEDAPVEIDLPLPEELQDDLLLIEAGVETPTSKDEPSTTLARPSNLSVGATSINQQYAEQPNSDDQPTAAIFDSEAYHKPLAHPAKKKSGWWLVLWIALLLVVGAGAGAAVYFYLLPLL